VEQQSTLIADIDVKIFLQWMLKLLAFCDKQRVSSPIKKCLFLFLHKAESGTGKAWNFV
jgi:hypothetical protein